ncbi:hypothetical protein DSCA_12200 [Desulfosarcina alkanivorans]|uniref:BioF2-like acetyltransferase domain-containing protein n=1 Tax=Desulfosarcina alkanivorans TaxID=571177 RepID=A0A5K7YGV0_9BACT|nr:FemAB family XrtA/PEP-CTERM system-associated protein [Desulfosarcina alkanivorans]BBO67290.1 hypothetical protein DSCA_12200 [Desulfosarcina alkanivorans]
MNNKILKIRLAKLSDQKYWDEYVLNHSKGSPYHLFAWKKAVESSYKHPTFYLMAIKDRKIVGVLPFVNIRILPFINNMVSLPFCDIGCCLADNLEIQDFLIYQAIQLKKSVKAYSLNFRGKLYHNTEMHLQLEELNTGKVRMILDLPDSADKLLSSFKSKLRSQVRKAEKNGVTFRWGSLPDMDAAYNVFSRNMRELGSPVHSKFFLKAVLMNYGDRAKLGLAQFQGKTIGMGIILLGGEGVSIPWASTLRDYNRLGPNMLLYLNFLQYSADNGYSFFDFGRSSEGEGTYKFKKQWGAFPKPLVWYEYIGNGKDENKPSSTDSRKREIAAAIWQKLPLGVANTIGPHIRKYISL